MSELTDLEICKRIAEIEGFKVVSTKHELDRGAWCNIHKNNCYGYYNPLTDDALCFKLMVEHELLVETSKGQTVVWFASAFDSNPITNKNPNKAICLAIIEAYKDN